MTPATRARVTRRSPVVDATAAAAVDLARAAAEAVAAPGEVGEHVGLRAEGDRVVTHYFASGNAGYRGWNWAVTVVRASRARVVTVNEIVLLPGDEALLAPEWVPWSERLRPGDLGVGDLLPTRVDDPRLVAGFAPQARPADALDDVPGAEEEDQAALWELGLGRARVLSSLGRDEAIDRWYDGTRGPRAPIAAAAPAQCSTCGFYVQLAGSLRRMFGVCANEYSPEDGQVVSADHGCGAHSEVVILPPASGPRPPVLDELSFEELRLRPASVTSDTSPAAAEEASEELGHS